MPRNAGRTAAIVVAGGRGVRFGRPKQFVALGEARLVDLAVAIAAKACDEVVLVVPAGHTWRGDAVAAVVTGGDTRSGSVRAGLAAVSSGSDVIVVHDAARPLATPALFGAVIDAVRAGADGAIPAVAVSDALKRVSGDRVVASLDRESLVAVQTPQGFRASALRAAHESGADAADDAELVESAGFTVVVVPGDPRNHKITTEDDLVAVRGWLDAQRDERA